MPEGAAKTDMGRPDADLAPEQNIAGMRKVSDDLEPGGTGKLFEYDGSTRRPVATRRGESPAVGRR